MSAVREPPYGLSSETSRCHLLSGHRYRRKLISDFRPPGGAAGGAAQPTQSIAQERGLSVTSVIYPGLMRGTVDVKL
jgi:hypothetical protein